MKKALVALVLLVGLTMAISAQSFAYESFTEEYFGEWTTFRAEVNWVKVAPWGPLVYKEAHFDPWGRRIITEYIIVQPVKMEEWYGSQTGYKWQYFNGRYQWRSYTATRWWYRYVPVGPTQRMDVAQYYG